MIFKLIILTVLYKHCFNLSTEINNVSTACADTGCQRNHLNDHTRKKLNLKKYTNRDYL